MAVEPLPRVTPRGPTLKHEIDLEHAHTLDRREVRRQNSGRQAIVGDKLERYAPMDGWRWERFEGIPADEVPQVLQELAQRDNKDGRNRAPVIENGNAEPFVNMMPGQHHLLQPMNFDRDQRG